MLITFFISISLLSTWFDKIERRVYGVKPGVEMAGEQLGGLLPAEVREIVESMAVRYQKIPVEPRIDRESGAIIAGEDGSLLDIEANINKIMTAGENEQLKILIIKVKPRYCSRDLEEAQDSLGYYETWFRGSYPRYSNISLATRSLNNFLLWPGDTFSFNEVVGPRTPERGYMPAPVLLMGSSSIDYGGGICQVSSTLYNAAEKAEMEIIERHRHSKPIHYVPPGRDATVDYGNLDLKFANNQQGPVVIKSGVDGSRIWVKILGRKA